MRLAIVACVLLCMSLSGEAQWAGSGFGRGRSHPLYQNQNAMDYNLFTAALFGGFEGNDLMLMQALGLGGGFGFNFRPQRPFRRPSNADMKTLSLLGIIDGPDVPDGPAGGRRRGASRPPGRPRPAGPPRRGGGGGEGPEAGAGGEEAAPRPAKKKPVNKRPARKRPARRRGRRPRRPGKKPAARKQ